LGEYLNSIPFHNIFSEDSAYSLAGFIIIARLTPASMKIAIAVSTERFSPEKMSGSGSA